MESAEPPIAPDAVRIYLSQLSLALEGQDAALRHDALLDAEAHLRAAVAAGAAPERAVTEYGTPAEIARAYADADGAPRGWRGEPSISASGSPAPIGAGDAMPAIAREGTRGGARDVPVIGVWFDGRAWGALLYFGVVGFVLSLAYFVWAVVIGALSLGLSPIVIGIPLFVFLLGSARAICLFEGKVVELFLRVRMPRRTQPVEGVDHVGFWQRIWCWLRDVRSWMSLGYLLGNFPVSVVTFAVTFALAVTSFTLLAVPVLYLVGLPIEHVSGDDTDVNLVFMGTPLVPDNHGNVWITAPLALASLAVGLALATATLWLARGFGWVYGHVVQAIQVARPMPMRTNTLFTEPPIVTPQ
jgi:hypothetical protein